MQRISSSQTFFMKWIFPAIWLGFVAVATGASAYSMITGHAGTKNVTSLPVLIGPVMMLIFGFVLFPKFVWDLADSVDDARDYLVVRRGSVEQRVMLSNVVNVNMSQMTNPPRLTLRLRKPCAWGDEIVFIPKSSGFRLSMFKRNAIAEDLIRRVDETRHVEEPHR